MKILVSAKRVVDYNVEVRAKSTDITAERHKMRLGHYRRPPA